MPPAPSMLLTLFPLMAGLACLLVSVVLAIAAARQSKLARREIERRLQVVVERLWKVESQIAEFKSHDRPISERAATAPVPLLGSRPVRATQSSMDLSNSQGVATEPTLIAVPDLSAGSGTSEPRSVDELGDRHGEAWALAAAGVAPAEIARRIGQPIGQVELIVGLYRKLHSSRGSIDHARSH